MKKRSTSRPRKCLSLRSPAWRRCSEVSGPPRQPARPPPRPQGTSLPPGRPPWAWGQRRGGTAAGRMAFRGLAPGLGGCPRSCATRAEERRRRRRREEAGSGGPAAHVRAALLGAAPAGRGPRAALGERVPVQLGRVSPGRRPVPRCACGPSPCSSLRSC